MWRYYVYFVRTYALRNWVFDTSSSFLILIFSNLWLWILSDQIVECLHHQVEKIYGLEKDLSLCQKLSSLMHIIRTELFMQILGIFWKLFLTHDDCVKRLEKSPKYTRRCLDKKYQIMCEIIFKVLGRIKA